ncbi:hypothetical protein C823_000810 [Eubacterium plexicaudatum ASF492]|uniref:Deacetylase PdaC domain-containing protein n=1 Tax=Eubacterium plexicaudatum ASF492 TaxID=1235802 RepID=N1ZX72_9FIRM|nr:hypothetical protein C823_000810 [Eubacterium plexicaudatum ASF492]
MRRKLYATLLIFAAAGMTTSCGTSFEADESTVYITKDGNVIGADIEDFNKEYYDEEELKAYITESIENYVESNGDGSLELRKFQTESSEEDGVTAQLYLDYATYIDYALFNDVTFFAGTVSEAQQEEYAFDRNFLKVEEGAAAGSMDIEELLKDEKIKVVIIADETVVQVDGDIRCVSEGNTEVSGKNTVRVHYDVEDTEAQPAYIFYK